MKKNTSNKNYLNRRIFLNNVGTVGALTAIGSPLLSNCSNSSKSMAHVVIIGAGFGGATCAKYLRKLDQNIKVTLIDANASYKSCPFSNTVLSGIHSIDDLTFGYDTLQNKHGIEFVNALVTSINHEKSNVQLSDGSKISYDKLVVSPGIAFTWNSPEGYDETTAEIMPHAWKAGVQTLLLRKQLEAMDDGGLVAIAPPPKPFRCPPGPYERASMIASYLKSHKPNSKILILDANEKFSKQELFMQGWKARYPGMIEWVSVTEGGSVQRVDAKRMTIYTDIEEHKVAVANVIPAQTAGNIVLENGLTDASGWCPVDQKTFESTLIKNIHVLGDAALAGSMPKSASAANSQAKVCALAITAMLKGEDPGEPSFHNTCYSLVDADYGISVNAIYGLSEKKIKKIKGSGGVSPMDVSAEFRANEAKYAKGWFDSITADTFA
ncbi:MAG: FCSD flavin-binding domain-containing protein [Gammaproteobacteria bacterium]